MGCDPGVLIWGVMPGAQAAARRNREIQWLMGIFKKDLHSKLLDN